MLKPFKIYSIIFLSIIFLGTISLIGPRQVRAFSLIGDLVTLDVTNASFSVVWEATIEGSIDSYEVLVYSNDDETGQITYTPSYENYSTNGIFAVMVDLSSTAVNPEETVYYKVKVVEDSGDNYFANPDSSLIPVTLAKNPTGAPPTNGTMLFKVYKDQAGTVPAEGAFVYAVVTDADYPVAGDLSTPDGWVRWNAKSSIYLGGGTLKRSGSDYNLMWSDGLSITIHCLGGDFGRKTNLAATYDVALQEDDVCVFPPSDCTTFYGKIIVLPNQAPTISITDDHSMRILNNKYVLLDTENFELDVRASDAEGEAISNWALTSEPGGMTITEQSDANYAKIEWDPGSGDVRSTPYSVSVTVQDINENTGSLPFTILITDGNPTAPDKPTITPANPITGDPLGCTGSGGSDPLDPSTVITYEYAWFKGGADQSINQNSVPYTSTTKGDEWSCSVKAVISGDKKSAAVASDPVTIGNTTATATFTLNLTNETDSGQQPTVDDTLRATVSGWAPVDPDSGDVLDYKLEWRQAGSLISTNTYTADQSEDLPLPNTQFSKGENIEVKVTLREDTVDRVGSQQTASMTIQNTPPETTSISISIAQAGNGDIECTIDVEASDADGDNLDYHYRWVGVKPSVTDKIVLRWVSSASDTLSASELSKEETWHCEIIGVRDDEVEVSTSVRNPGGQDIYIANTSPEWDVSKYPTISPSDTAYNDSTLTCTVDPNAAIDRDGDPVTYSYAWYNDAGAVNLGDANTLDPSVVGLLVQGDEYYCEVTACDDSSVCIDYDTNSVLIGNRDATIKVWKGNDEIGYGQTVQVTETEQLLLVITCHDDDNNALEYLAPNMPSVPYSDPNFDSDIGDPNYAEFTWTPAQGDAGTYDVVFKVEETYDSQTQTGDTQIFTHLVKIKVIYPSNVIDNFEFQSEPNWYLPADDEEDMELRTDHGWSVLTGSGDIFRYSYENDPNDHYLNMVSNESDPLKYITTLWLADPNETKDFYEVRCDIDTNSPYTVEAYVHVVDTVSGVEKDYFLRYIPEDPNQHGGNKFEVDAMRINYYIGSEFIDPNGCSLERNMEDDIHNAIAAKGKQYQSHYDFVWGFILRGGIDKFDNLEVVYGERDTVSPKDPKTGSAVGIDKAVVLTWEDDPNQDADVLGYEIAYEKDSQIYTSKFYVWETGISGEVKICTIPFELNSSSDFPFTIKAFDDAKEPNYSSAIGPFYARPHEDTNPPDMATCDFTAQAPKDAGETINLAWTDPNEANLSYFKIYMNGIQITDPPLDKTILEYQVTGLVNDTQYDFKLEGFNGDNYGSSGTSPDTSPEVTGIPRAPELLVFDNFEYVAQSQTPMQHGWKVLQGSGNMAAVEEDGNSCMHMTANYTTTAKTNFIITKFVDSPEDYTNTKLYFNLKGLVGEFKIDLFISDTNGNRYFLRYSPNAAYDDPKPTPCKVGMYITHYLDWRNNNDTTWHPVVRDLQKDLQDGVPGATFGSFLGMVIRGEVFIDDILFMRAMPEVGSLVAISGNALVDLFWTRTDPNVDVFYLSVDGAAEVNVDTLTHSLPSDGNQCSCTVDSLTNDTEYDFTVKQGNSSGVTISATPHDFGFTEGCVDEGFWADQNSTLGSFSIEEDPEIHSDVLVIDPDDTAASGYLIRYFVELDRDINPTGNTTGKSKVMVNIKSGQDFVLWFTVEDTIGVEYNLLYASGQGTDSAFGTWSFSYLPACADGNWIDGNWHTVDLELNDNLLLSGVQGYGVQVDEITNVSIGGCDDVSVDNLGVY